MRILFVTREHEPDKRYGLGRSLAPLVEELGRRGHRLRYLCQGDLTADQKESQRRLYRHLARLLCLPSHRRYREFLSVLVERLAMGRLAAKVAARDGYSHVHCHDPIIAAGYRFWARLTKGATAAWGVTEHGFGCYMRAIQEDGVFFSPRLMRWAKSWEARVLKAASWVIAPTQAALLQLARDLDTAPLPATWRCVYHARPQIRQYPRWEARRRLGWDAGIAYIVGVGRLVGLKRFPLLIEACGRLADRERIQLVLLGDGDEEALRRHAREAGLVHDVLFALTDDIGLYLCAADLYVSASASESFGLANLEAMLCGVPVVATAVGGVPEVVGEGAWLVPAEAGAAVMTQAMQRVLDDTELRETLVRKGRMRASAWPDVGEIANTYEDIYRTAAVLERSRRKG